MKAMIFAAGVGSRLRELTKDTPKCLMSLGTETILEHVVGQLKRAGVSYIVINVHHHAEKVIQFVQSHKNFGLEVTFSREQTLLDTGGGLKNVKQHFVGEKEFLIHNADIYCEADLNEIVHSHRKNNSVATVAVMKRPSKRGLYLSPDRALVGWTEENTQPPPHSEVFGFCGISVGCSELFEYMDDESAFSIIRPFLKAARATGRVKGEVLSNTEWLDIGTPEQLETLRQKLATRSPG